MTIEKFMETTKGKNPNCEIAISNKEKNIRKKVFILYFPMTEMINFYDCDDDEMIEALIHFYKERITGRYFIGKITLHYIYSNFYNKKK